MNIANRWHPFAIHKQMNVTTFRTGLLHSCSTKSTNYWWMDKVILLIQPLCYAKGASSHRRQLIVKYCLHPHDMTMLILACNKVRLTANNEIKTLDSTSMHTGYGVLFVPEMRLQWWVQCCTKHLSARMLNKG